MKDMMAPTVAEAVPTGAVATPTATADAGSAANTL
jgi:hypothetical protein